MHEEPQRLLLVLEPLAGTAGADRAAPGTRTRSGVRVQPQQRMLSQVSIIEIWQPSVRPPNTVVLPTPGSPSSTSAPALAATAGAISVPDVRLSALLATAAEESKKPSTSSGNGISSLSVPVRTRHSRGTLAFNRGAVTMWQF
jgi:hypothetical protein